MVLDVFAVSVEWCLAEGGEGGQLDYVGGVTEAVADLAQVSVPVMRCTPFVQAKVGECCEVQT